ncbi:hypothetical protein NHF50_07735 [Flavobacterium sp. NRK F10]|uniref:Uncharacterized protein n=1 Tax=Flavobacterium sediminis TaxID=2201181 RepID=A0A2U8QV67_9FLAO|nr:MULTISPECIES: hypothetical protein [Flavobacterium]AWM13776.1 hypothetical protein DI487_07815 [Flavobacterium sediminis]MCO6174936.1 hypothetical protein [Flavobacterium sp. NRK F10]
MKKVLILLLLSFSVLSFSQKVKFKKGNVLIDGVEVYKYENEGSTMTLSTLGGEEFVSFLSTSYEVPNPARSQPGGHNYPATLKKYVVTVRFLESGKELFTDLSSKEIAKAINKSELVSEDGSIDEEKLDKFINKYNNETLKLKIY